MKLDELNEKLWDLIVKFAPKKEDIKLDDSIDLETDLGYTSLELIQLIVELESLFDIEMPDEYLNDKMYNYRNLKSIVISMVDGLQQ